MYFFSCNCWSHLFILPKQTDDTFGQNVVLMSGSLHAVTEGSCCSAAYCHTMAEPMD